MNTLLPVLSDNQTTIFKRKVTQGATTFIKCILVALLPISSLGVFANDSSGLPVSNNKAYKTSADPATIRYVDSSKSVSGNGLSWSTAYKTLAEALSQVHSNTSIKSIYIAKGTYFPTSASIRDSSFTIYRGGINLYGGYPSGGGIRNPVANPTILSGDIGTSITQTDNSYHVMVIAGLAANADSVTFHGLNFYWGRAAGTSGSFTYNGRVIPRTSGGGIALSGNLNELKILFKNCRISGNYASNTGGGIYVESSIPIFLNCLFSGNYANYGGAAFNYALGDTRYLSCTISGNHDNNNGGGMRNSSAKPIITNSIISGNSGGISKLSQEDDPGISSSLVQNFSAGDVSNLNGSIDPLFVDPVSPGTVNINGDYRLQSHSPCLNKGLNYNYIYFLGGSGDLATDKDFAGNKRLWDENVEMGAFELLYALPDANGRLYVAKNSSGSGISWASPIGEVADALKFAKTNTNIKEIWVSGGIYNPLYSPADNNFGINAEKDNSFLLVKNVKVYGSFAGTETDLSQRNLSITNNKSILSGDLGVANDNSDNSYHVVVSAGEVGTATLNGFTITNGNTAASGAGNSQINTIDVAKERGGGLYNVTSSPLIKNVIFTKNSGFAGGGVANLSASPIFTNVLIAENISPNGGGVYNNSSNPTFINATITNNVSINNNSNGAGMRNTNSNPIMLNTIIWGNKLANNFSQNIFNSGGTNPTSIPEYTNCIVEGSSAGWESLGINKGNNQDRNPQFANISSSDYSIKNISKALNNGKNIYFTGLDADSKDLAGNSRVYQFPGGGIIDIGAFEYQGPQSIIVPSTTGIVYVKQNATGNGRSWQNATGSFADALYIASLDTDIKEIWVAGGTYYPRYRADNYNNDDQFDQNNSFILVKNVKVYGGFAGTETTLAQRDLTKNQNKSTLSGDLPMVGNGLNQAYHVVISGPDAGTAELNGFEITNGKANGDGGYFRVFGIDLSNQQGSGICILNSNVALTNLTVINNQATVYGGGIMIAGSSPVLNNVTITGNKSDIGAGMLIRASSAPILDNVTISNNIANTDGGGIQNLSSSAPVLTDVNIIGNSAGNNGGGINNNSSNMLLNNVLINGNNAGVSGGGIFNNDASPHLNRVTLSGNSAGSYGGGIYFISTIRSRQPVLTNMLIKGNKANDGGGMAMNLSDPILTNVTISGNTANNGKGELQVFSGNPVIRNSIVWGNGVLSGQASSTNSLIQDKINVNDGNIPGNTDPLFVDASNGNFKLQPYSSLINKGRNQLYISGQNPDLSAVTTDLEGADRIQNGMVDLGAYECPPLPEITPENGIVYVTVTGSGNLTGNSWENASDDLQRAIDGVGVQEVWVAKGVYKPIHPANNIVIIDSNNQNNAFVLKKNIKIYGGFAGTNETSLAQRDSTRITNNTILSGDLGAVGYNSDNAFHVIISAGDAGTAELNGFTINAGNANEYGTITVSLQTINQNSGGGIYNNNSSPVLNNLTISENNAAYYGAGIYNSSSSPILTNLNISGNLASSGGGIYNSSSSPILTNVNLSGNKSWSDGGGIYNTASSPVLTNVIISGNYVGTYGGGICNITSSPILTNVTISGNTAPMGGGISNDNSSNPKIRNSIIYGNSQGIINYSGSTSNLSHSLVQGLSNATDGNMDASENNPNFVNAMNYISAPTTLGNYRLQPNSPVINKGNNAYYNADETPNLSLITIDLDSNARIGEGTVDLGAYESAPAILASDINGIIYVSTTGNGNCTGNSWANASFQLQKSINTTGVQQVWVAGGRYKPTNRADDMSDANPDDRNNAFVLKEGVKIYGSFAGTETTLAQKTTLTTNTTVLSGDLGVKNDYTDNAYHVVISAGNTNATVLEGFEITGGNADGSGSHISVNSKSIVNNKGGGISLNTSSPYLTNLHIYGNNAGSGGGMYQVALSKPVITNVAITGNTANAGGGVYNDNSSPVFTNATIVGNFSNLDGSAMRSISNSKVSIKNSIIYGNTNGLYSAGGTTVEQLYSLVQGSTDIENGNIDGNTDPKFMNQLFPRLSTGGDYHLQPKSPAINKGNNFYFSLNQTPDISSVITDLDGNTRIQMIIDLGTYEYEYGPLRVELLSYTAQAENNQSKLKWTTASETNNKEFIIYSSTDGKTFTQIGKVTGSLNSSSSKDYAFYDTHPGNGINYYRLEQVDIDGKMTDLGIRTVQFAFANEVIKLYPNPTKSLLKIEFRAGKYHSLELMDNNGKVLQRMNVSIIENQITINLNNQASGVYFVRLIGENTVVKKVVKE